MSIDAKIMAVTVVTPEHCSVCDDSGKDPETNWDDCPACHGATKDSPRVRLKLEPRERDGVSGQSVLTIVNPPAVSPKLWQCLVGVKIWGGSGDIMIGERRWAKRIGYTKIELINASCPECDGRVGGYCPVCKRPK